MRDANNTIDILDKDIFDKYKKLIPYIMFDNISIIFLLDFMVMIMDGIANRYVSNKNISI